MIQIIPYSDHENAASLILVNLLGAYKNNPIMTEKRHTFTSAVHLILEKEGKILLLRRQNTGFADGCYSVVAGHIDANETAKRAMVREAKEEALVDIVEDDLDVVHVMHRKSEGKEKIDFFLCTKKWSGEPVIGEPDKCDDLRWFSLNNLPENMVPYVKTALRYVKEGCFYSEFGW